MDKVGFEEKMFTDLPIKFMLELCLHSFNGKVADLVNLFTSLEI